MNTDDLAQLLRERSQHERLPPGAELHERIARGRRRRAAGLAAVAVAVALAVAAPLVVTRGGGDGQRVAEPPTGPPYASGRPANEAERTPATYAAGYRLADSKASALPAGNTFTYTFTPTTYDFKILLWCDSVWGSRLRAFIGDKEVATDYCEPAGKRGEIMPYERSRPIAEKQQVWQEYYGVTVGTPVTVTVKVHTGLDEHPEPVPPTASGVARVLRYEAVAFADYPFPKPPRTVPRIPDEPPAPGESVINIADAFDMVTTRNWPLNGYFPFSVTRRPGRDVELHLQSNGPGVLRIVVERVEVMKMEFWDWDRFGYGFTIDPALLPLDRSVAVTVYYEHFSAPVWRVTAKEVPA